MICSGGRRAWDGWSGPWLLGVPCPRLSLSGLLLPGILRRGILLRGILLPGILLLSVSRLPAAEPALVEVVRDFKTGMVSYRVTPFDTLKTNDGKTFYVEIGWCTRPRSVNDWRDVEEIQVTMLGTQGKQGIRPGDVADVLYWESRALDYVRKRLAEDSATAPLEAVLARLQNVNPRFLSAEREALELDVQLKAIRTRFQRRTESSENLAEALRLLDALMRARRDEGVVKNEFALIHAELGKQALQRGDFRGARDHARLLDQFVADLRPAKVLREEIRVRVRQLVIDSGVAERLGKADEARQALEAAELLAEGDPRAVQELGPRLRRETLRIGCFETLPAGSLLPPRTELQRTLAGFLYESLFQLEPGSWRYVRSPLVEAYEAKDNGLRVDVTLADGITLADGQPLTAVHVQAAFKRLVRSGVREVKLLGSRQLSIQLAPHPQPLELLATPLGIPGLDGPVADPPGPPGTVAGPPAVVIPLGSGPFVMAPTVDSRQVARLSRRVPVAVSGRGPSPLDEVVCRRYAASDWDKMAADLQSGELHLAFPVMVQELEALPRSATAYVARPIRRESVWLLAINHRHPLLQQRDARRAVLLAIPRADILKECYPPEAKRGRHQLVTGPFPPHAPAYDATVPVVAPDAVAAADLVRSLRMKLPAAFAQPLRLAFSADEPGAAAAMERVARAAGEVDLPLQLVPLSTDAYVAAVLERQEFDLAYFRLDHHSALYDLRDLFGLDPAHLDPGGRNFMGYQDENAWQLMIEACRGRTGVEVFKVQQQVHRRLHDQIAFIPLWWLEQFAVSTQRLCWRDADGRETPVPIDPFSLVQHPGTWYLQSPPRGR